MYRFPPKKLWRKIFERDQYVCQKCGTKLEKKHAFVDWSYIPVRDEDISVDNGQTLCKHCFQKHMARSGNESYIYWCKARGEEPESISDVLGDEWIKNNLL